MVGGNADFIEVNASVIVQANSKNDLPVRVVMANGVVVWAVAVDADGPIKSIRDLKGKAIGTFSQATGGTAYLNSYLRKNDIDPKDIDFIPLGLGAPPVHALQTDRVQGLFYWATAISSFENAGLRLRKLVGDDWQSYPDYSLATMQQTLNSDPATTAAVARAMAKSIVFAMANPDCMRRIQWKDYRATMAAGTDEATLTKWYTNAQSVQLETLRESYRLNGGNAWGAVDPAAFERLSQFMLAAKLIEKPVSGKSIVIEPAISAKVDDFDRTAIEASARECRL
jgi:NitT/TauT family transport system substrate-binding protein